jgi:carotenoid cleavage dioxygenase-like enzyme
MLFYGVSGSTLTWYHANSHGKLLDSHQFDMGVACFLHDFVVTEDYAVFMITPTLFTGPEDLMAGKPTVVWDPETSNGTRFAVLDRHSGAVTFIDGEGAYSGTHFYNAWFDSMVAKPWRWVIDLSSQRLTRDYQTNDVVGEFPRINDEYALRENRFGYYATTQGTDRWLTDVLAKHDYRGDLTKTIPNAELVSPSEPVFVPRDNATREDDGWMMSLWWNPFTRLSEMLIHDALHFESEPVARIKLNQRVPMGFHGNWIDGEPSVHRVDSL